MVSPEIQHGANEAYATGRGYEIVEEIEDLDLTGRFWRRREAERAVVMVEQHLADVIIVWKWSRLARNRRDWAVALDRVESSGGRLESSTEPIDVSTSNGRFARGVMAELAVFESERIGDVWREVQENRVAAGLRPHGAARWGYQIVKGGPDIPDPTTGPILAEMYRRYLAGDSTADLCDWLNELGYRGSRGAPWSKTTLRQVLDCGFGAGLVNYGGTYHPGAHQPVITMDEWHAYRAARQRRAPRKRAEASHYLLSGLVRCVHIMPDGSACGRLMYGSRQRSPVAAYRCAGRIAGHPHPSSSASAALVEDVVMQWLSTMADELSDRASALGKQRRAADRALDEAGKIQRRIDELNRSLAKLAVHLATGVVAEDVYVAARDEITAERDGLERRRHQMLSASVTVLPAVPDLLRDWDILPVLRRREMLRRLIDRVEVLPGRPAAKVRIVPVWTLDQ